MTKSRITGLALAKNLQRLMVHHDLSQAELAKRSGVGQRTLSTLLDVKNPLEINPRASTVDQLAAYFDIPSWQLLIPALPIELLISKEIHDLVQNYRDATEEGRAGIARIAISEARYAVTSGHKWGPK